MKILSKIFNIITLNFILGTLTGLIVNTYTGSAENHYYDLATWLFIVAILSTCFLTIIQSDIHSILDNKINANLNEPAIRKFSLAQLEEAAFKEKSYFKWSLPLLVCFVVAFSGTAIYCFHEGNLVANHENDMYNTKVLTKVDSIENINSILATKVIALDSMVKTKQPVNPPKNQ